MSQIRLCKEELKVFDTRWTVIFSLDTVINPAVKRQWYPDQFLNSVITNMVRNSNMLQTKPSDTVWSKIIVYHCLSWKLVCYQNVESFFVPEQVISMRIILKWTLKFWTSDVQSSADTKNIKILISLIRILYQCLDMHVLLLLVDLCSCIKHGEKYSKFIDHESKRACFWRIFCFANIIWLGEKKFRLVVFA